MANPNGITNVYRLDVAADQLYQITNLFTGVSGITAVSPALSSARDVAKIAFSIYQNGDYNIYVVDAPDMLAGQAVR